MGLRFGTSAEICLACFLTSVVAQSTTPGESRLDSASDWTATVQVLVRNARGVPVGGLGVQDFIVQENGGHDTVLEVREFGKPVPDRASPTSYPQGPQIQRVEAIASEAPQTPEDSQADTAILILLPPMSAPGRHVAIAGIRKFLVRPPPQNWRMALLDDAGVSVPFSINPAKLRSRLDYLEQHSSPPQYIGGPWVDAASTAIGALAMQPGRHAIVFASDFQLNVSGTGANPWLMRVGPSSFTGAAIRAQAAMYTIQASGPGMLVPFGGAAEYQWFDAGQKRDASGPMVADFTNLALASSANELSDFLSAADTTGGRYARDVDEAFDHIAADAEGYYRVTFKPTIDEPDGAWHPVIITARVADARVSGPHFYRAPIAEARAKVPAAMLQALHRHHGTTDLDAAARAWLFPDIAEASTSVLAADLRWPERNGRVTPGSKVQIFAELVDLLVHGTLASWVTEREWHEEKDHSQTAHWQREATLYPGVYSLRIVAMDKASGKIATRAYDFAVNVSNVTENRVGQVLIASRCLRDGEREGRTNLFDPLMHDGCILAPSASASVSLWDNPTLLVRIYPQDEKDGNSGAKQWKAYAVLADGPRIPLTVTREKVRGLVALARLDLANLKLRTGTYPLKVVLDGSARGKGHAIALKSQLTLTP